VAAFIAAQRADHGVPQAVSCQALGVSQAWFYKWRQGDASPRRARRERLQAEIARLFEAHQGKRGSPMITADLAEAGWAVSKNTVAALMAGMGLAALPRRRRRGTTRPGKGRWRAPDLVKRDFSAQGINRKWYGDGTEIPTGEGKLQLASVLDMGSRRILGFALGEHHDAELAYGALAMAATASSKPMPSTTSPGPTWRYTTSARPVTSGDRRATSTPPSTASPTLSMSNDNWTASTARPVCGQIHLRYRIRLKAPGPYSHHRMIASAIESNDRPGPMSGLSGLAALG
jgi:hypothetical protein